MPELVHWFAENPVRWVIPAVLLLAVAGIPVALWWEKHRPSVPAYVAGMRAWRSLSTGEQEAADEASLDLAEQADMDARENAGEAARVAVERATTINALSRF